MSACALKVELLRFTPEPEQLTALAARLCYSGATLSDLAEKVEASGQEAFLDGVALLRDTFRCWSMRPLPSRWRAYRACCWRN